MLLGLVVSATRLMRVTSQSPLPFSQAVDTRQGFMAAEGIFVGLKRETILKIQERAVELILEGKTVMSWSDGVTNASKQFSMPPKEMLDEANYALQRLDGRCRALYTNYNRLFDR